jgi:tRNA nucleotidyltransferase (CCA-adding enzyme)
MEESQAHGIIFSPSATNADELNTFLAKKLLQPEVQKFISAIPAQAKVFLVGGAVRDALLGKEQLDMDFCCSLSPQDLSKHLSAARYRCIDTGLAHGTLTVLLSDQLKIEITAFRTPGVRDSFKLGNSIEEDLSGRDFTINALAFDLRSLKLIDSTGGLEDLKNRILRTPGDSEERIAEDPLRILRAVRFGPAAGRKMSQTLVEACRRNSTKLEEVAVERIRVELEKILLSPFPRKAFLVLHEIGALQIVLPEVVPTLGFEQNEFHHEDVFQHTMSVVERAPHERILKWSALLHDLGKPGTLSIGPDNRRHFYNHEDLSTTLAEKIMGRLKFSEKDRAAICLLVKLHMRPITCGAAGARRLLRDLGPLFDSWLEFKKADRPPIYSDTLLQEQFQKFEALIADEKNRKVGSVFDPLAVDGNDLKELGLQPGKIMGQILRDLREKVIMQPELNEKNQLLTLAKEYLKKNYPNY